MRNFYTLTAALLSTLLLAGCQSVATRPWNPQVVSDSPTIIMPLRRAEPIAVTVTQPRANKAVTAAVPQQRRAARRAVLEPLVAEPLAGASDDSWELTRQHMRLERGHHPSIDEQLAWFRKHSDYVLEAAKQATPYYQYVLSEVIKRQLPAELALLPMVESRYNPNAVSPSQATGTWQFIPSTADLYGLRNNWWYDGRRDIIESTQAALDYLEYLNQRFDGDWLLTLAAYNGGEGTLSRSIKRNQKAGRAADYWHLELPRETQRYVPKLLAIAQMIDTPQRYNLTLPEITTAPYFAVVPLDGQIELNKAAKLAGIAPEELARLNPGFSRWATDPEGPHRLLVPVSSAARLQHALAALPASERVSYARYKVRSGDTLSGIAKRFGTRVAVLRKSNNLVKNRIRTGQDLLIPAPAQSAATQVASNEQRIHRVTRGDNLWKIARQYGVSTEQLADWNSLSDSTSLRPGQDLILYPNTQDPG